jgi:hypothetical protein
MTIDLAASGLLAAAARQPWRQPEKYWQSLSEATADCSAPVVAVGVEALAHNAHDLLRRAKGRPIRVASKSIRVRGVLDAVLALPGYRGVLAYTLAEALWLSERIDDVVVAYPSVDRAAFQRLAQNEAAAKRVTVMIDSIGCLFVCVSILMHRGTRNCSVPSERCGRRCMTPPSFDGWPNACNKGEGLTSSESCHTSLR